MRKREFAPGVYLLGLVALVQIIAAALMPQLTRTEHVINVTSASLAIMLSGWVAYGLQRARAYRRHRREADALRGQGEVALGRFAESLVTRD